MRNISFALTTAQIRARSKTVTRRMGWGFLHPGDRLCGIVKGQGLKRGEKVERLGIICVTDARREPLRRMLDDPEYGRDECAREGFPDMTPAEFVAFYCRSHSGCTPEALITRIEFEYLD